ncbi:CotS family spore coat protein [Bacillus sp. FJAT-45350]|uniref:CotS family spore coat protein n=1 Tax=Bacillus sp. FJAT-45350 TaxID=2011014 RepID=UPI000BB7881A|nr:CotS family spore coat protein [Bacillus sp. FJAT-45350]
MDIPKKVMSHYSLKVKKVSLLSDKGKKAVWSIITSSGDYILKKVPIHEGRLAFMIRTIDHLNSNGVLTPGVINTSNGEGYVLVDDDFYVLFEAIKGKKPAYKKKKELEKIVRGLATFHKASSGIVISENMKPSYLLGGWKEDFQRRYNLLEKWKQERQNAPIKNKFDQQFLLHVDTFLNQCKAAMLMLHESCYDSWVEDTKVKNTICHQDFAAGNLAIDKNGHLNVFDMDSLTIDLPIRDIRKLLNKVMKKQPSWDLALMIEVMTFYQKVSPLSNEQYKVLVADLLFPHLFFGQVNKYYGKDEKEWSEKKHLERIKEMVQVELSKEAVIKDFFMTYLAKTLRLNPRACSMQDKQQDTPPI